MDGRMDAVEVLGSRILLHPSELERSHRFYRDQLGLAIYREFGSRDAPGLVFFMGNGLLEVSGRSTDRPGNAMEMWIADPDGVRIVLVEVPDDHPLRRDQRDLDTLDD
jgi:hypothetical protein